MVAQDEETPTWELGTHLRLVQGFRRESVPQRKLPARIAGSSGG